MVDRTTIETGGDEHPDDDRVNIDAGPSPSITRASTIGDRQHSKYGVVTGQTSIQALRSILRRLLDAIEANVDGVVADLDSEYLHDLRVACRRTRSALSQLKGILPKKKVQPFRNEFKWLGTVTGPCRDLDVLLIEIDRFQELPNFAQTADLEPLTNLIHEERSKELRKIRQALQSEPFQHLLAGWRECLDDPPVGDRAGLPVDALAGRRIHKTFQRMLKHQSRLAEDPAPADLHRLRIDAKKLRYLLEFFHSLYPRRQVKPMIDELKKVQDVLGGYNDCEVQRSRIQELAGRLDSTNPSLQALDELQAALKQRQETYRNEFAGIYRHFAGPANQTSYEALLSNQTTGQQPGGSTP